MDRITSWETEAMRGRSRRPRPRSGVIDLRGQRDEPPSGIGPDDPPPGTLLVPLDAWQRMLDQLGNLHEAGQQLAEASARAAKAETEAEFLRERVADLRRQLEEARSQAPEPEPAGSEAADPEIGSAEASGASPGSAESSGPGLVRLATGQARSLYRNLRARISNG